MAAYRKGMVGFGATYKCLLLPQSRAEQVTVSKNASTLKINPENTSLLGSLHQ